MKNSFKIVPLALLVAGGLSLTGCAGDYCDYGQNYDYVDYEPICVWPVPDPHPGPVVVAGDTSPPRHTPLPKPTVQPGPRIKEPDRQPRTPAPRTPKPRDGGGTRSPKNGQVRR